MKCRRAVTKDAKTISRLVCDTIRKVNSKDYTPRQINAWIENNTVEQIQEKIKGQRPFFVITDRNRIVGVSSLKLEKNEMSALYVKQDSLQSGFGSVLLKFVEKYAKNHGVKQLRIDSSKTAFDFYKKRGYQKIKTVSHLMNGVKITCILMKKKLKN
ncbi:MAG: GNAT family N-acetyltransferase [Patescibacteria group bacterium]|jgi:putative acetyltransferase